MGLYEIHKSQRETEAFGVVIENNANRDMYVDFIGYYFLSSPPKDVNIYPLYRDLYFKEIHELMSYIFAKPLIINVTKFQSSSIFIETKQYYISFKDTDANGQTVSVPFILQYDENLPNNVRRCDNQFRINYGTTIGMLVEKNTDMVIKFYPANKKTDSRFYTKMREECEDFENEKMKRLRILI